MEVIEYAKANFLEAVDRPEFVSYATGNPDAEVEKDHAIDCGEIAERLWGMTFGTPCPEGVVIAGIYQDCDRWFPKDYSNDPRIKTQRRAIDTKNIPTENYDLVNRTKTIIHPQNCAAIFRDLNPDIPERLQRDISYLIEKHEIGGQRTPAGVHRELTDEHSGTYNLNAAADIVMRADGLSFFNVILPSYLRGRPRERVKQKIRFSYEKLSETERTLVKQMMPKPIILDGQQFDVNEFLKSVIAEAERTM